LDKSGAAQLTRYNCPWLIKGINTDPDLIYDRYWAEKAVIWLCGKVKKPILRLVEEDYEENGLAELI
jgi:glucosamine-6-phosphate deaminase